MSSDRDARARRVLVVDDEAMMLDMISAVLADWADARNVEVIVAPSSAEALAVFERLEGAVDLIVSDLIMPGGNGSDLLLEVRRRWPEVATMIVSGASDVEQMRRVTTAGVFAYLVKPFDPAVLIAEADKALEIALLRRENRRHEERLRGELAWAGELQRALLRPDLPPDPRFVLSVVYLPLAEFQCGGDFYAVLGMSADRRQFLIGDVGGHGIRAALVTTLLKALVAPSPESVPPSPGELLGRLNRRLCEILKDTPELLVTFLACEVDASSRTLVYSGAGHLPLYVLRGDEALAFPSGGTGLGFDPAAPFEERTVALEPADRLVLYTDGVREGVPGEPAEAERAFSRLLLASRREKEFAPAVIAWAKRLAGRDTFADDATVLGVTIG
jgi:sigma-B regulation protein RsbU (phosphoserine phosphatase)